MNIHDFNKPDTFPFNTFGKYKIESFMWWFLLQCYNHGDLDAVITTRNNEDRLVEVGILKKVDEKQYQLTTKSKGILYSVYGKSQ